MDKKPTREDVFEEPPEEEAEMDEEDFDDEDEVPRKRRRGNQFLDVEAEVDDDEEEDEDEEEAELLKQNFIQDDHVEHREDVTADAHDDRMHRKLDRTRDKIDEEDAQQLAEQFKQRYGRGAVGRFKSNDSATVSQRLLLPSVDDPHIWGVRCRNGKEKEVVRSILTKKMRRQNTKKPLEVFTAFQRDNFIGYVYIEARKLEAVSDAIQGLSNVFGSSNKVLVPVEEYPDLLRPGKSTDVAPEPGNYVRVRQGKYKGDLAQIEYVEDNGLDVLLKIVPRIDYGTQTEQTVTGDIKPGAKAPKRKATGKFRPASRFFSEADAASADPKNLSRRGNNVFLYKGNEYRDGFLFKDFRVASLELRSVHPTLEELTKFQAGSSDEGLDISAVAQSIKQTSLELVAFQPGDRVEITSGEQATLKGKVVAAHTSRIVSVAVDGMQSPIEIPTSNLRKIFNTGDHVRAVHGKHTDDSGLVVAGGADHVTFISDQTREAVTVFANYLVKSTDTTAGFGAQTRFDLMDLVQLNSDVVGVVVRSEREAVSVLCTDGRCVDLSPSAVAGKLSLTRTQQQATDKQGSEIRVGDTVRETAGERRSGPIVQVYRTWLFVKAPLDKLGVFVVNALNVENMAKSGSKMDLERMNPGRMNPSKSAMAPPPIRVPTGRDFTLNKLVSIRRGGHKGKKGMVKQTNGDVARVELSATSKIVPINKEDLLFEMSGRYIPYEEFLRSGSSRGGPRVDSSASFSSGVPAFSSMRSGGKTPAWGGGTAYGGGGKTPAWGSGGKTPAWGSGGSGGKTPAWGGGTTAYASGGKTPAWGSGNKTPGGKTPAWGSGTSYGGKSAWNPDAGGKSAWAEEGGWGNTSWNAPTPGASLGEDS